MKICFTETDASDEAFFRAGLGGHDLQFADALEEAAEDAEVLSIFINSRIDAAFLDKRPKTKLIVTRSTGCDHIDAEACAARGVIVCNVAGYGDHVVAEHTFALLLALTRRLGEASVRGRRSRFSYAKLRGVELKSKTLGIVGTGRTGAKVASIAKAFGMRLLAFDARPRPRLGLRYVSLRELLKRSHIISLHLPLTAETRHLLDARAFAACRPGVLIINTARGRLIDTQALVEAMDKGVVGGAGLDVLGDERLLRQSSSSIIGEQITKHLHGEHTEEDAERVRSIEKLMLIENLLARPNVVFTPHTAFNCIEAVERINRATVRDIEAFASGKPVNTVR